ncbi:hypothetical protein [Chitinophaga sp.]|uniref:thiamine phosphate synthase n=1 Tax=Chitinophaga sp. TaxID=1869181 RepID=UPI002F950DAC
MIWIITSPERIHEEERIIAALLSAGTSRVLLRKPDWDMEQYRILLNKINPDCYNRILIRDQPTLAAEYGLAGVHWSSAARSIYEAQLCHRESKTLQAESIQNDLHSETLDLQLATEECSEGNTTERTIDIVFSVEKNTVSSPDIILPTEKNGCNNTTTVPSVLENSIANSTGIHSATEITYTPARYSTLLLSPVFDSISKPGYYGRVGGMLTNKDHRPVLALGGVDHTNIVSLKKWQYDGAALLGAIWKTPAKAVENYYRIQQLWNKSDLTS